MLVVDVPNKGFCLRKRLGRKGKPVIITINYLTLTINDPKAFIFHYNVRIEPEPFQLRLARKIFEITEVEKFPNSVSAYDGRGNLFTRKPIAAVKKHFIFGLPVLRTDPQPFNKCEVFADKMTIINSMSLWDEEKLVKRKFKIYTRFNRLLRYIDALNYTLTGSSFEIPKNIVQAVETILNEAAVEKCQEKKLIQVGKSYFFKNSKPLGHIGGGVNLHSGFKQTVSLGSNLFQTIHLTYGCFFDPLPVIDVISLISTRSRSDLEINSLESWEVKVVRNYLKGIRIVYQIPGYPKLNKEYSVNDIADPAESTRIQLGTSDTLFSLSQFYLLKKNYVLKYPRMPCIIAGPPGILACLPAELCTVSKGQHFNRPLNNYQKQALNELFLELKPEPRQIKKEIIKAMSTLELNKNKRISDFDITISKNLVQVKGRILKPPIIICKSAMYSGIKQVTPFESSWELEHFEKAVIVSKWAICSIDSQEDSDLRFLATALRFRGLRLGMRLDEPKHFSKLVETEDDFANEFEKFLRDRKSECCEVVFVVMPNSGALYGKVKQVAELQVGMVTQCLKSSTVKNLNLSTMNNILLKLNAKLNGNSYNIKSSLWPKYFIRPVIVIGSYLNITDQSRDCSFPVIASIVGNCNKQATRYKVLWSFLKSDSFYIENLNDIITELITHYWKQNDIYPEKILYYRDGILDGNLLSVMNKEVEKIREGCRALNQFYQPSITFVEVTRTHPTMFLPGDKRAYTIPTGTIVDSSIAHSTEMDFYLLSHLPNVGPPIPTKYHVLLDESNLSEDDIQELTFYLCHLSSRCTRSVSFPVPLYYAHLATHRAKKYLDRKFINGEHIEMVIKEILNVKSIFQDNPMFFV